MAGIRLPDFGDDPEEVNRKLAKYGYLEPKPGQTTTIPDIKPGVYESGYAKEFGFNLDEGWSLKVNPDSTFSYLSPDKWEITGKGEYINPEGKRFTRDDLQDMIKMESEASSPMEDAQRERLLSEYSDYKENERLLQTVFPKQDIDTILSLAEEKPEEFALKIAQAGRNENTEGLLKRLFPDIAPDEVAEFFNINTPPEENYGGMTISTGDKYVNDALRMAEAATKRIQDSPWYIKAAQANVFSNFIIPETREATLASVGSAFSFLDKFVGRPWEAYLLQQALTANESGIVPGDEGAFSETTKLPVNPKLSALKQRFDAAFGKYGAGALVSEEMADIWSEYKGISPEIEFAAGLAEAVNPIYMVPVGGTFGIAAKFTSKVPVIGRAMRAMATGVQAIEAGLAAPLTVGAELTIKGSMKALTKIGNEIGEAAAKRLMKASHVTETLMTLPSSEEILKAALASNWQRSVIQTVAKFKPIGYGIEKGLGYRVLVKAESDAVKDVVGRAAVVRAEVLRRGPNAAKLKYMELASIHSQPVKLFGFDKNGFSQKMAAKALPAWKGVEEVGTLEHVFTHPEAYVWEGFDKGVEYVARVHEINTEVFNMLATEGVDPKNVLDDWYMHRVVKGKVKEGKEIPAQKASTGGGRPPAIGKKQSYEKQREFKTMWDGVKNGLIYDVNPEASVVEYIEEAMRKVADDRFIKYLNSGLKDIGMEGMSASERLARFPALFEQAMKRVNSEEGRTILTQMLIPVKDKAADRVKYAKNLITAIDSALRDNTLAPQTLESLVKQFPEMGRELSRLLKLPTEAEGRIALYMEEVSKYTESIRKEVETARKLAMAKGSAAIADLPEDDLIRAAFARIDQIDRSALRNGLSGQADELTKLIDDQRTLVDDIERRIRESTDDAYQKVLREEVDDLNYLLDLEIERKSRGEKLLSFLDEADNNPRLIEEIAVENPELAQKGSELYQAEIMVEELEKQIKDHPLQRFHRKTLYYRNVVENGQKVRKEFTRDAGSLYDILNKTDLESVTVDQARTISGHKLAGKPWPKSSIRKDGRVDIHDALDPIFAEIGAGPAFTGLEGYKSSQAVIDDVIRLRRMKADYNSALSDSYSLKQEYDALVNTGDTNGFNPSPLTTESGLSTDFWGYPKPVFSPKGTPPLVKQRQEGLKALREQAQGVLDNRVAELEKARAAHKLGLEAVRTPDIGEGYLMQPFAAGKIFDREFIDAFNKYFGHEGGFPGLNWLADASGILRIFKATLDMSAMAIQGLPAFGLAHANLFTNPKQGARLMGAWAKAFSYQVGSFFDTDLLPAYMTKMAKTANQRVAFGGSTRAVYFFEELTATTGRDKIVQAAEKMMDKIPLKPFERAEVSFMMAGEVVRDEFWKIMSPKYLKEGKGFELAQFLDKMTGVIDSKAIGVPMGVRQIEQSFGWFAPNYTRACLSMLGDIFRGGLTGAEVRKALGGMIIAGAVYYAGAQYAISALAGKDEKAINRDLNEGFGFTTDPITGEVTWKPGGGFMALKVANLTVGVGGFWYGLVRLANNIMSCVNEVGDKSVVDLYSILKNGSLNYQDNPFIYWWYSRSSPVTRVLAEVATNRQWDGSPVSEHKDFLKYPIETAKEYGIYIGKLFVPISIDQGIGWMIPGYASDNEIPENEARAILPISSIFGLNAYPASAWAKFYDKAKDSIQKMRPEEIDPNQQQAFKDGTLGWKQLTAFQKQELIRKYPDLAAAYEKAQQDSTVRGSQVWKDYEDRKKVEKTIYTDRVNKAVTELQQGKITTEEYRKLVSKAGQNYGAMLDAIEREPHYADIYAYFDKKAKEGDKYGFKDDLALTAYESQIKYAADLEDALGNYDWDERDRRVDAFIKQWGLDTYERIQKYYADGKIDSGWPLLDVRRASDMEKLGRAYWRLPYASISDIKEEVDVPAEYMAGWREYKLLKTSKEREAWLEAHPEYAKDWRAEYRQKNPEADATLALWGYGGKLQSEKAYDLVVKWSQELGIPFAKDNFGLPPKSLLTNYFDYNKMVAATGNSSESKLYRLDNPAWDKWGQENLGWMPIESNPEVLRINVKYKTNDKEYDALKTTEERQKYLYANSQYADDRRRREAIEKDLTGTNIEAFVAYNKLPDTGYAKERYLMDNLAFFEAGKTAFGWKDKDFSKVPSVEVEDLYAKYESIRNKDGNADATARMKFRLEHPDLDAWLVLAKGFKPAEAPKTTSKTTTTKSKTTTAPKAGVTLPPPPKISDLFK
jgi:hypothetical protein